MTGKFFGSAWKIILFKDLHHLWVGWKGILFLLIFSLFLSVYTLSLSINPEINAISQSNWINLTVRVIVLVGMIVILMLSANSISGERDNGTLESLLLTPIKRSHIAIGKTLSILSLWAGMFLISIPYLLLVTKGSNTFIASLVVLGFLGTLLVVITALLGGFVSALSSKNITSFIVSFSIVFALVAPVQLPGKVQQLPSVNWFISLNPFTAAAKYQNLILVEGASWIHNVGLLLSPMLILTFLALSIPFLLNKYLSLQGGITN